MHRSLIVAHLFVVLLAGCGSSPSAVPDSDGGPTAGGDVDGGPPNGDAASTDGGSQSDAAPSACNLPPPNRSPCVPTLQLGKALPLDTYGALEGELIAVLPPGSHGSCPNDSGHVHLQVAAVGAVYDIAIDDGKTDGVMFYLEKTLPMTLPAEGWSNAGFDYKANLGVSSTDFTQMTPAQVDAKIVAALANVSRLTIHGKAYTDGTGVHDVHYNHGGHDGVLLLHGEGANCGDKALALHFVSDTF